MKQYILPYQNGKSITKTPKKGLIISNHDNTRNTNKIVYIPKLRADQ